MAGVAATIARVSVYSCQSLNGIGSANAEITNCVPRNLGKLIGINTNSMSVVLATENTGSSAVDGSDHSKIVSCALLTVAAAE